MRSLNPGLSGVGPFGALGPKAQEFLQTHSAIVNHARGSILFHEHSKCEAVYILCSGRIKLSSSSREGRSFILQIAQPGDVLGLSAALDGGLFETTAEALESTALRVIPLEHFRILLCAYADASLAAAQALARWYRRLVAQTRVVAPPTSSVGRMARLIMEWSAGADDSSSTVLSVPLTHCEWAEMTGMSRETVSRTLMRLRKQKIIAAHGIVLRILNPSALQRLSES